CKPIIDGAIDAGLADDDSWQALRMAEVPTIGIDRERPRVEVTFFGDEDEDQTKSAGSSKGVGQRGKRGAKSDAKRGSTERPATVRRTRNGDATGN
ncbi:MAG: hypothetical protein ACK5XN_02525, partial [Bacteroidota bacterium]